MLKRIFDLILSVIGIVVLFPLYVLIAILIVIDNKGPIIFKQKRVGKNNNDFTLLKFRTMLVNSDKSGLLTVGEKDSRITRIGFYLRKYKIDELPQLFNVLKGEMSFVGPRPEVRKYVSLYSKEQMQVLSIKPGITDYASIKFINESEILGKSSNPEDDYIKLIMPEKLKLNLDYIHNYGIFSDIEIILTTLKKILFR